MTIHPSLSNSVDALPSLTDPESWLRFDPSDFRIIVADDLEDTRFVIRRSLAREGYEVEEARDGQELLDLTRLNTPDLVIADILMPVMDGLTALTEIRKDPKLAAIYCILLTGKGSVNEKIEGFQLGADDYVTKPYSLAELKARVQAGIRIKAMQRALGESLTMLARQEKLATIGVMANGIAHEFNNIMSGISGYAQLARQNEKFVEQLIKVALEQTDRARRITTSLSTFTKSGPAQRRATSAAALVDSATCLLQKELRSRGVKIELERSEVPAVTVDPGRIQQALVHILLNAIQAAGEQESGRIVVSFESADGVVRIVVDDNGPGISEDSRGKIFDPFFTTRGALQHAEEPGNGLGLTFAQNIVQSHGGQIQLVESRLGGASFAIDLPLAATNDSPRPGARRLTGTSLDEEPSAEAAVQDPVEDQAPSIVDRPVDRESLVLVEDDPVLQELVQELFECENLVMFPNCDPAIDHCRTQPVRAVVLDLGLADGEDGRTVLTALADLPTPPPVVLTTGSHVESRDLPDYPRIQILPKPYGISELEQAVNSAVESSAAV